MNFNWTRYLELLKRSEYLKSQNQSFFKESRDEKLELNEYEAAIAKHSYWNNRHQFAVLLKNFVNKIITGDEFSDEFWLLSKQLENKHNELRSELRAGQLKSFQPDVELDGFANFMSFIRAEYGNFEDDCDSKEFYDSMKNCLLQLQIGLNKEF